PRGMGKASESHILSHCRSPPPPVILEIALSTTPEIKSRPAPASAQGVLRVGVIGYGYWGPNLVRNFSEAAGSRVVAVSDLREERRARVGAGSPAVRTTADSRELLADPNVDAVIVATPVATHYRLAMAAIEAGKHVLVEKPLAMGRTEAEALV